MAGLPAAVEFVKSSRGKNLLRDPQNYLYTRANTRGEYEELEVFIVSEALFCPRQGSDSREYDHTDLRPQTL